MITRLHVPAAIDPLAVIFSTEVYLMIQEKLHPNVPLIDAVKATLAEASAEQRQFALGRAKMVNEMSKAVVDAVR